MTISTIACIAFAKHGLEVDVVSIKDEPLFNSIRNEPEFQNIVKDMEFKFQAEHERVRKWSDDQKML